MTEAGVGDSLEFTVRVPESVHAGDYVRVRLRLANVSSHSIELHLQGRETLFDVVVLDASGAEVWRRLGGVPAQAILQLRPLAAGEAIEFVATWHLTDHAGVQVPAGDYQVLGELPGDAPEPMRSAPAPLRVSAPREAALEG